METYSVLPWHMLHINVQKDDHKNNQHVPFLERKMAKSSMKKINIEEDEITANIED